ncbi:MAG TPA: leucyl/phenylalanyl-tRNA--protein transferase [Vicinamibacteria bacterium]|nr:leucyl/phenylalanyl-tRNA--protein transferase [Vicinamibacteria bacterium]
MPVYLLGNEIAFPPADQAEQGLLAVGGDLSPERLLAAYSCGIFPWYSERDPILWHSPDPRFVLTAETLRIPKRLRRRLNANPFRLTMDSAFGEVITRCARARRPGQRGTWITAEMSRAYTELHRLGFAHSVETWSDRVLVGGLYGVSLGGAFFGESMFAERPDASKIAFVMLVRQLERWGIGLIDCQIETKHLARFGAVSWPRSRYLIELQAALSKPTRPGRWEWDWAPHDS